MINRPLNIGFISTRFAGSDGVSLETKKWVEVLSDLGHNCFYFAGECDWEEDRRMVVPEAFYRHPEIKEKHDKFFCKKIRTTDETAWIKEKAQFLKQELIKFTDNFKIELIIPENALTIPLHIPLGLAITELIAESGIPTIAHHHDFTWERKRFLVNCLQDYISMSFPPHLDVIQHVVINTHARQQLALRCGVGSMLIPNVMNYQQPPPGVDDYNSDLRTALGLESEEIFVLQPTRIVERKGIEHAIELVHRLGKKARLIVSHAYGDEGEDYAKRISSYAELMGVNLICAEKYFDTQRGTNEKGEKVYSIWDAYIHADLVTYPSVFEGFGNAFLEAVYFRKPIVVNNYSIFSTDIKPKGFDVIEFDDYVTEETVRQTHTVINDRTLATRMANNNFELARKYFSYDMLRTKLKILLANAFGTNDIE